MSLVIFFAIYVKYDLTFALIVTAQNLEDGVSRMTGGSRNEGTSSSCSNANSSSGFYSSASCKEQVGQIFPMEGVDIGL